MSTEPLVIFLGDSLTAGYGLPSEQAFPNRLAAWLKAGGRPVRVVNAGVSGDTSADGLRRLSPLLETRPNAVVLALGFNDGYGQVPTREIEANLGRIVTAAQYAGAKVLLVGARIPAGFGPYAREFAEIFPRVASEHAVPLVPFLLEGVAGDPRLNLPDGIHPAAEGHVRLAQNVLPHLLPMLDELARPGSAGR